MSLWMMRRVDPEVDAVKLQFYGACWKPPDGKVRGSYLQEMLTV